MKQIVIAEIVSSLEDDEAENDDIPGDIQITVQQVQDLGGELLAICFG